MTDERVARLGLLEKAALLSGGTVWQTRAVPRLGIPSIWLADGPHGVRKQSGDADHLGIAGSEPATCFPTAAAVANSWDEELAEEIGAALGREARSQDVHVLLGPGLNIKRSPLGGRNFEYFSEDPELSGRLAAAYVRGIQSAGVAATPKHFAANSQELRRMASDSIVDERTLREIYLSAFETVVREGRPWAIMSSYNLIDGTYAHENAHLLDDILRREWGFDGAVISDWGGGNDPVAAVRAGGTLEMPSPGFTSARRIVAAVEAGELDVADLDARVEEVLWLVDRTTAATAVKVDLDAHHALARRAAAESTVLLRNEGALLPLASGTRVALIGDFAQHPRYQGAGSSLVNATRITTLLEATASSPLELVRYAQGFRRDGASDASLLQEARSAASAADVAIVCLGLPENAESEGVDRGTLELPAVQVEALRAVIATGTRVVVLLSAGASVETGWASDVDALVYGSLGGQAGAEGLIDVLTGAVSPGGRLAETFVVHASDAPTAGRFPSPGPIAEYREGPFVGYRYHETAGVDVAFPFGFGLGYTTFAYRDLAVSEAEARFTVANTGAVAGTDVPQVYVARRDPSGVVRPALELRGFRKVRLEPGASVEVVVPLGERAFRFWDVRSGSWQVEAGAYEILVGASVRDIRLSARIDLSGSVAAGTLAPQLTPYVTADIAAVTDEAFAHLLGGTVPRTRPSRELTVTDPLLRMETAPSRVARLAFRILDGRRRAADRRGRADLNMIFLLNMPFRSIGNMSGGMLTPEFVDAVLTLVNGHFLRGVAGLARAYVRGRRHERRTRSQFEKQSGVAR